MRRRSTCFISVLAAALLGPVASASAAPQPQLQVTADCTGAVSVVATSWAGDASSARVRADQRVNGSIRISVAGARVATGSFDAAGDYQLRGRRSVRAASGGAVDVVVAYGRFGVQADIGSPGAITRTVDVPAVACPPDGAAGAPAPSAVIGEVACGEGAAIVTMRNTGTAPVDVTLTLDGAAVPATTVPAGAIVSRGVALPGDLPSTIVVSAPGMAGVTRRLTPSCPVAPEPSPTAACTGGRATSTIADAGAACSTRGATAAAPTPAPAAAPDAAAAAPARPAVRTAIVPKAPAELLLEAPLAPDEAFAPLDEAPVDPATDSVFAAPGGEVPLERVVGEEPAEDQASTLPDARAADLSSDGAEGGGGLPFTGTGGLLRVGVGGSMLLLAGVVAVVTARRRDKDRFAREA